MFFLTFIFFIFFVYLVNTNTNNKHLFLTYMLTRVSNFTTYICLIIIQILVLKRILKKFTREKMLKFAQFCNF